MNTLKNKVQLVGNLGNAAEIITLDNGIKRAKFSMATNDFYYNKAGDKIKDTQWHQIIAWGNIATLIEKYTTKGQELMIEGKLTSRSYDDSDGIKRYITEVVCNEILFLGNKSS